MIEGEREEEEGSSAGGEDVSLRKVHVTTARFTKRP
jgi:hypothetical protein